jgi:hypothetical protein
VLLQILTGKEPFHGIKDEYGIQTALFTKKLTPLTYLLREYKQHLFG